MGGSGSGSDEFHLGIGVHRHHIVALRRLDPRLGVTLAIEPLVQEEVTTLLEIQAAVAAHEALRVVQLVPRLDNGAPDGRRAEDSTSGGVRGELRSVGKAGEDTHTMPWPQRVHSGNPCRPLSGVPSLLVVGLRFRGLPGPDRSPESRSAGGMSPVPTDGGQKKERLHFCGCGAGTCFWDHQRLKSGFGELGARGRGR